MRRTVIRSLTGLLVALLLMAAQRAAADDTPININTASAAELATLKGIGPAKAQAIVDHREKNGQFKTVDDLKLVRGIGDKMLEQLRSHVTVDAGMAAGSGTNSTTASGSRR